MGKDLVQCHTADENHYRTVVGHCNYTDEGDRVPAIEELRRL